MTRPAAKRLNAILQPAATANAFVDSYRFLRIHSTEDQNRKILDCFRICSI
jgi:hypothetical protein